MNETVGRPRRWWVALLLNLILPPTGYAYAGAWDAVGVTAAAVLVGAVAIDEVTLLRPPGIYALGAEGLVVAAVAIVILLGLHAAWLARRAPDRIGPLRPILYLAPWLGLFTANALLTAYWPYPAYVIASASMQPTLQPRDIVIVRGPRALCGRTTVNPGDVVLYKREALPQLHRAVAGPGQTVAMRDGQLIIDGRPVERHAVAKPPAKGQLTHTGEFEETLANGARYRIYDSDPSGLLDQIAVTTVPPGSWYLLGDNRHRSADSRVNGPIRHADICATGFKIASAKDKSRVGQKP